MPEPCLDAQLCTSIEALAQGMEDWFERQPLDGIEALGFHVQSLGMAINAQIDHYCSSHATLSEDVIFFTLGCILLHRLRHPQTSFSIMTFGEENADA